MSATDDYSGISTPVATDDYSGISTPVATDEPVPAHAYDNQQESAAPLHGLGVSVLNLAKKIGIGVKDFAGGVLAGSGSVLATLPGNQGVPDWQRGVYPGLSAPQPDQTLNQRLVGKTIANMAPKTPAGQVGSLTGQIITPTSPLDIAGFGKIFDLAHVGLAATKKLPNAVGRMIVQAAEEQTAMPAAVLKKIGTPEGLAAVQAVKGQAYNLGQQMVQAVYHPWDAIPEGAHIKEILPSLPSMPTTDIQNVLTKHIVENAPAELKPVNDKIIEKMNWIKGIAQQNPDGKLTASDLVGIRQNLDKVIDNGFGQDAGSYLNALKDVRHAVKENLLDAAKASGNTDYQTTMIKYANKLDLVDRLKAKLGQNIAQGDDRAEGFVNNLFGKNRTNTQETLKDFDKAFGTDFYNQANATHIADYLSADGKIPLFTKWSTGRSGMLGKVGALTIGSPRVMSWALNNPGKASVLAGTGTVGMGLGALTGVKNISNMLMGDK